MGTQMVRGVARGIRKIIYILVVEARKVDEARERNGDFRAQSAMHRRDILQYLLCALRQKFLVRFKAGISRERELVQEHLDMPDVTQADLAFAGADARVVGVEDPLSSTHHRQARITP